eukprot:1160649-Pelagomonas_calceolata.AAC.7
MARTFERRSDHHNAHAVNASNAHRKHLWREAQLEHESVRLSSACQMARQLLSKLWQKLSGLKSKHLI